MNTHGEKAVTRWQRIRTIPGLLQNIVVLVLFLAVGGAASSYMLTKTSFINPFSHRYRFSAEFASAPATNPSVTHKVTIAGVPVGNIVGTHVTDRGSAIVDLDIEAGHPIYDNARAVLRTINPLNEMYIEINQGGPPGRLLPEGGALPIGQTERPIQADEVLAHLDTKALDGVKTLLSESDTALAHAPEQLPGGFRATDQTLVHLRPVMAALQTRREKIGQVVTAFSQIATAVGGDHDRIARLANSTEQALGVIAENDADLQRTLSELPGFDQALRHTFTSTQDLTKQLNPTLKDLDKASDALPPALSRFTDTAHELNKTVGDARPFVAEAQPVVKDLRPFIEGLDPALHDFVPVTGRLGRDTGIVESYLTDLQAFVFNTSSVFSVTDARGPMVRGHVVVPLPDGGAVPNQRGGYAPGAKAGNDQPKDKNLIHLDGKPGEGR